MPKIWSIVQVVYDNVHAALWAALCTFVLWFLIFMVPKFPAAQAYLESQRIHELLEESRYYCEKWGMPLGTQQHEMCLRDLQVIRNKVERRIEEDRFF
jgi:hypothetical protein